VGGVYVPAIKALSLWFRKEEFATRIGLLMSVGNFGAVIATTPLAWAATSWGWRLTFFMIGGITLALSFVTLLFTRDFVAPCAPVPADVPPGSNGNPGTGAKVFQVLSSGRFWVIAAVFFGIYGTLVTLQGLWATPFLMTVLNIERIYASKLNMLIPIGVIVGAPLFGWLTQRFSLDLTNTLFTILGTYTLTWVGIIFFSSQLQDAGLSLTLIMMGVATGGFISTIWAIVRENTPLDMLGLTSGMLNMAPFLGVAAFQVLTGAILDKAGRVGDLYPLSGFRSAFLACLVGIVLCLMLSLYLRKPRQVQAS
jgi:MFS family permease